MKREQMIRQLEDPSRVWDVIIIGGGATGLGAGVDAASRGYSTLVLEQGDFAEATSSRSTKLVHGGVRYLQQGNIALVMDALKERGIMLKNAPHLVYNQAFIVPDYRWWERPFYGIGLKLYDMLAGKLGFGPSKLLSKEETLTRIPTLKTDGLKGGVVYHDGQFDDARLAVTLARTMESLGQFPVNHMEVTGLLKKKGGVVEGVTARDRLTGTEYTLKAKSVVNAAGIFVDNIRAMDNENTNKLIAPSQGVHLILDKSFAPGDTAVMVPHTDDGRVIFMVPWHDRVIVGTTDTPIKDPVMEPTPLAEEIDFLLSHAGRYLSRVPSRGDVLSVFTGIRPLISGDDSDGKTSSLSRDHHLTISPNGLVTIAGGKWTTYRKMGEDTIDRAAQIGGLPHRDSQTRDLKLHGWCVGADLSDPFHVYGSYAGEIKELAQESPELAEPLHPSLPYTGLEVAWAARNEWACTVADVLSRRTRSLLLGATASVEAAPRVAAIMAKELGKDQAWIDEQIEAYGKLAANYMPR
ncbi:glycerol-3-phosphate dehydrogenase/oxidase [Desulfoluna spongiiphila]|uniref:Glycerol-3-phosphate dehydrogenase n=1 Tax=Desulfoluna spongiiphila TaxID=419481 RepID=A0A1G5ENS6_9BACT|nr:glycerol-3-phosphate dehydrogenase/oxidase [Desulfoluna spongiiphila]SCY28657.1 glycerol-3-phosphate dehydrogenase [Desulfoluna spongiiphila]